MESSSVKLDGLNDGCFVIISETFLSNFERRLDTNLMKKRTKKSRRSPRKRYELDNKARNNLNLLEKLKSESTTFVTDTSRNGALSASLFPALLGGTEAAELLVRRKEEYGKQRIWSAEQTFKVLLNINEQFLTSVCQFVDEAHELPSFFQTRIYQTKFEFNDIPTGLLFSGLNPLDHSLLFNELLSNLVKNGHLTCRISSKDCTSLKALVLKCTRQLVESSKLQYELADTDLAENTRDANEETLANMLQQMKRTKGSVPAFDMRLLQCWYKDTKPGRNMVILLEDFEAMDPHLVCDFVLLCSSYSSSLPFVFLITVSTGLSALHQSLPKHVFSKLQIEQFRLRDHFEAIDQVIETLFIQNSNQLLKLAPAAFAHLLEQFQCHHFSVGRFYAEYSYALLHHFYSNPLAVLFNADTDWSLLSGEHAARMLSLPSFGRAVRRFLEQSKADDRAKQPAFRWELERLQVVLQDTSKHRQFVLEDLVPMALSLEKEYHAGVSLVLPCAVHLQQILKSAAFRKPIRTLYDAILNNTWFSSAHFSKITGVIRGLTPLDLAAFFRYCRTALSNASLPSLKHDLAVVDALERALNSIYASESEGDEEHGDKENAIADFVKLDENGLPTDRGDEDLDYYYKIGERKGLFETNAGPVLKRRDTKRSKLSETQSLLDGSFPGFFGWSGVCASNPYSACLLSLQQTQQLDILNKTLRVAVDNLDLDMFRSIASEWCSAWFKHRLASPSERLIAYEAFYYCNSGVTRQAFHPNPRQSVLYALTKPSSTYFGSPTLGSGIASDISSPDTCVSFQLLQQSSRMVNLRDWFEAFCEFINTVPSKSQKRRKTALSAKERGVEGPLARFIQTVRELEYLGFIKPTTRKPDHVLRLTWD